MTDAYEFSITKSAFPGKSETQLRDVDADGLVNWWDKDSDGDSLPDSQEGMATNDNGFPLFLDPYQGDDYDPDNTERELQEQCTGRCSPPQPEPTNVNKTNFDTDQDGIPDTYEGTGDSDKDGLRDFEDPDSDGDGILDEIECDGGMKQMLAFVACADTDSDGTPDYLDADSDGDGIPDSVEGVLDDDNDGVSNFRDLDSDGWDT